MDTERLCLDSLLDASQRVSIQNGANGARNSPAFHHIPMKPDWAAGVQPRPTPTSPCGYQASGYGGPAAGNGNENGNGNGNGNKSSHGQGPGGGGPVPYYAVPTKNCAPTCPLDSLLLDFLHERRQRATEGLLSTHEIIGPRYPSVSSLLNPTVSHFSHPLSKVFTDILQTFSDLKDLPERVAVLYVMFLVMRWQVSPTEENYDRLPSWAAPGPAQLFTPHPAWVDHLPFPRMREKLVRDLGHGHTPADVHPFDQFFTPFTSALRVNWPYEDTDALLQSPDSNELMINPVFERHVRRLENWTLSDAFAAAFPGLAGTYNLKSAGGWTAGESGLGGQPEHEA